MKAAEKQIIFCRESVEDNPYLSLFYGDMGRWAWHMESFMELKRHRETMSALGAAIRDDGAMISDWGPPCVFAAILHADGQLTDDEWRMYRDLTAQLDWVHPQVVYYLHLPVFVAKGRIRSRGRECEQGLTKPGDSYLSRLNAEYKRYLGELRALGVRVEYVDAQKDIDEIAKWIAGDMEANSTRYAAIMGIIGAGKTTICEAIAR